MSYRKVREERRLRTAGFYATVDAIGRRDQRGRAFVSWGHACRKHASCSEVLDAGVLMDKEGEEEELDKEAECRKEVEEDEEKRRKVRCVGPRSGRWV